MPKLRKVLFIAYNFPPHGGAGVQRSLKFVKYLPQFGWRPLVVTTSPDASPVQDPSLLDDVPDGTPVYPVPGFSITGLMARARKVKLGKAAVLLNLLLQIPDPTRFWAMRTHQTIDRIIAQEKPEIVYTTSGPYSSHLVGAWVRRKYRIPWFADFRDPWSENLLIPYLPGYRALNRRIERGVLAQADRVASVSQPWLAGLQANLGTDPEKFIRLPNGFDDADIRPLPYPEQGGQFTLTHLGSFYRNRRPDPVITAVKQLIKSGRIPESALRLLFIGKNARQFVPQEAPFEIHDYVPHKALEQFRRQSHALLLILATSAGNMGNHSGKLFEYMASNRPILAIVPPGGVAQAVIEESRTGIAVDGDIEAIAGAIETLYRQWKQGMAEWSPDWEIINRYTRRNLTRRLALTFNEMADPQAQMTGEEGGAITHGASTS